MRQWLAAGVPAQLPPGHAQGQGQEADEAVSQCWRRWRARCKYRPAAPAPTARSLRRRDVLAERRAPGVNQLPAAGPAALPRAQLATGAPDKTGSRGANSASCGRWRRRQSRRPRRRRAAPDALRSHGEQPWWLEDAAGGSEQGLDVRFRFVWHSPLPLRLGARAPGRLGVAAVQPHPCFQNYFAGVNQLPAGRCALAPVFDQQVQKKWKKKSGRCGCLARTVRTRLFSAMRALPLARATVSPVASVQPGGWAGLALLVPACAMQPAAAGASGASRITVPARTNTLEARVRTRDRLGLGAAAARLAQPRAPYAGASYACGPRGCLAGAAAT